MNPRTRLSRLHETEVAELLGGHQSKSSGNQWHDAADGKHKAHDEFAFAWDCKCVLPGTNSISISRADWLKITEQARGRRPAMPLRFYTSERGHYPYDLDLIVIRFNDFLEMRERIA